MEKLTTFLSFLLSSLRSNLSVSSPFLLPRSALLFRHHATMTVTMRLLQSMLLLSLAAGLVADTSGSHRESGQSKAQAASAAAAEPCYGEYALCTTTFECSMGPCTGRCPPGNQGARVQLRHARSNAGAVGRVSRRRKGIESRKGHRVSFSSFFSGVSLAFSSHSCVFFWLAVFVCIRSLSLFPVSLFLFVQPSFFLVQSFFRRLLSFSFLSFPLFSGSLFFCGVVLIFLSPGFLIHASI